MASFDIGSVILGKYEVTRVLGQGGMGVVVAAHHRDLDELVALKFLLPSLRDDAESCARFAREARNARRIKSDHVARVYDVDTFDGTPFLVMEYLTGKDLAQVIRERGPLPASEAVDLLLQACEAIADAHHLGIVHRDLKPANLFLTAGPDGTPFVKVLDFGLSKVASARDASVTASAAIVGSPSYMAPEQLESGKTADPRSDVWALGVILYELLTGTRPFAGDSFATVCAAILRGRYRALTEHRPDAPPGLEQAIAEALACDAGARLPSVEALAARIAPFGSGRAAASVERIHQIAARRPAAAQEEPERTIADGPPSVAAHTAPSVVAQSTKGGVGPARGLVPGAPARRRAVSLAGGVGAGVAAIALVGLAAGWSRWHRTTTADDPAALAAYCRADADSGNACDQCRSESCCAQHSACQKSPDCQAFLDCGRACKNDKACRLECIRKHPEGHATAVAEIACGVEHCAGPCGEKDAPACLYCQESNCSRHIAECTADPACDTLRACITACRGGDDTCMQACRKAAPTTAQDRYDAIGSCALRYCLSTCLSPVDGGASHAQGLR